MTYTKKYIDKFKNLIDQIKKEEIESLKKIFKRCKKKITQFLSLETAEVPRFLLMYQQILIKFIK